MLLLSVELRNCFDTCGEFFFFLRDVAEDVLGAAKEGSDLAQDVAVDVLGAAKNGSAKAFIVKVFILPIVKARAGHAVSFPRLSLVARKRKAPLSSSTPLPLRRPLASSLSFPCPCGSVSAATRMVTVSGHRGPGALKLCAHRRVKHPFNVLNLLLVLQAQWQ